MKWSRYLSLFPFFGLALLVAFIPIPRQTEPTTHRLTMTAGQFAFDPPLLRVNQGDRVILTLQAEDVVHGFYLDGHNLDARIIPGLSQQVEFVADRQGKFRYRCSVSCGSLHPFMTGELIVQPNLTFARAVGLTLVVLTGTLVYLWRFPTAQVYPNKHKES